MTMGDAEHLIERKTQNAIFILAGGAYTAMAKIPVHLPPACHFQSPRVSLRIFATSDNASGADYPSVSTHFRVGLSNR